MSPELALVDAALAAHLRATDVPASSRPTVPHLHLVWDETAVESVQEAAVVEPVEVSVIAPVAEVEENDPIAELVEPVEDATAVEPVEVLLVAPMDELEENDPLADLIVQELGSPDSEPTTVDVDEHDSISDSMIDAIADPVVDSIADPIADPIVEETDQQSETSWYPALPAPADGDPESLEATQAALREIRDRLATPEAPAKRRKRFRRGIIVASGLSTALALGVMAADVAFGVTQLPI